MLRLYIRLHLKAPERLHVPVQPLNSHAGSTGLKKFAIQNTTMSTISDIVKLNRVESNWIELNRIGPIFPDEFVKSRIGPGKTLKTRTGLYWKNTCSLTIHDYNRSPVVLRDPRTSGVKRKIRKIQREIKRTSYFLSRRIIETRSPCSFIFNE